VFDLVSCLHATNRGGLEDWVHRYLSSEPWANAGLRDGLRLQRRYWIGPLLLPLDRLERCCGPEPGMKYRVQAEAWELKVSDIAAGLRDCKNLPPLIVEWRSGRLVICDGNHRFAAMVSVGWQHCWIILWCNDRDDYSAACAELVDNCTLPTKDLLLHQLRRDGWVRLPGAVAPSLLRTASAAIELDLARSFDANRQVEYDNISYCPGLRGTAPILELMTHSLARKILDDLLGWDAISHDQGQIAIRRAHNADRAHAPVWHIDGVGSGKNGLAVGDPISNFTALVGVYLTPIESEYAGNFVVWPGSHDRLQAYFRDRGPMAMREGKPEIQLGESIQLLAMPGDMIICHYQLAHTAAVNLSSHDRIAIYFRIWLRDIDTQRWALLTNIWQGWRT